jgi:translation initiation factor eIF-2B subunit epsilon
VATHLKSGACVSFQVEVGGGFRVPAYSRISMLPQPVEDDNSDEELEYDQAGVGAADATKGRGSAPGDLFCR